MWENFPSYELKLKRLGPYPTWLAIYLGSSTIKIYEGLDPYLL